MMPKQNVSKEDGRTPGAVAKKAALRTMALAKLEDAQRFENDLAVRIDIAADSCYLFALSLLDVPLISRRVPDAAVSPRVARQLSWEPSVFNLEPLHLWFRLFPTYHPSQLTALIALAERLRDAQADRGATERHSASKQDID